MEAVCAVPVLSDHSKTFQDSGDVLPGSSLEFPASPYVQAGQSETPKKRAHCLVAATNGAWLTEEAGRLARGENFLRRSAAGGGRISVRAAA